MHQLNKQTVELNLFEQSPGTHGQFSTERFIIFFLIVLGFVGLFYSLPTKTGSISAITTNTNFSNAGNEFAMAFVPAGDTREEIQVLNEPKVGKETFFQFPASRENYKVTSISFGDGMAETLGMKNKIGHVYTRPGKYEVTVKVVLQYGKLLYLRKVIEVKPATRK